MAETFFKRFMKKVFFALLFLLVPLLAFFYTLFFDVNVDGYKLLSLLPLSFALCSAMLFKKKQFLFKSIVFTIFLSFQFIRLVLVPVLIVASNFFIFLGNYYIAISNEVIVQYLPISFVLMCFEHIVLSLLLNHFLGKTVKMKEYSFEGIHLSTSVGKTIYFVCLFALLLFVVASIVRYPSLARYFNTLWKVQEGDYLIQGSTPSSVYRIYIFFCDFLQILIPLTIVYYLNKYPKNFLNILLFLIIDLLSLIIVTNDKMSSIIIALVLLIWYLQGFKKKPAILYFIGILTFSFAGIAFLSKNYLNLGNIRDNTGILTGVFNSYFCGPFNVSISVSMSNQVSFKTFVYDAMHSIPFMPTILKNVTTSPMLFNYYVKGSEASVTKIIPMIGQGYAYFGPFAPVLSAASIFMSIKFENMMKANRNKKDMACALLLFMTVICAAAPFIYNLNILIKSLCKLLILYFMSLLLKGDIVYNESVTRRKTGKQSRNRDLYRKYF